LGVDVYLVTPQELDQLGTTLYGTKHGSCFSIGSLHMDVTPLINKQFRCFLMVVSACMEQRRPAHLIFRFKLCPAFKKNLHCLNSFG